MIARIQDIVKNGSLTDIEDTVSAALAAGTPAAEILEAMTAALGEVGARFQRREIFVPDMLVSAMTVQRGVGLLRPFFEGNGLYSHGKYIIGTVRGDIHDIGKNLVAMMVGAAGFEVIDLGVDVPPERFVQAVLSHPDCRVVGISALLTTTLRAMETTVEALTAAGVRERVKIMVGGTPVTARFAASIGADAYTENAAQAAMIAAELAG